MQGGQMASIKPTVTDSENCWIVQEDKQQQVFLFYYNPAKQASETLELIPSTFDRYMNDVITMAKAGTGGSQFELEFEIRALVIQGQNIPRNELTQHLISQWIKPGEMFQA